MKSPWWKITLIATSALITIAAVSAVISVTSANQDRVILGVQSDGTTIAGMTYDEAHDYFASAAQKRLSRNAVIMSCNDKSWKISPQDIDLTADVDKATKEAYAVGRDGSAVANLMTQLRVAITGQKIDMTAKFNEDKLQAILAQVKKDIDRSPVNAAVTLAGNGSIVRKPAVIGQTIDMQPVAEEITPKLEALHLTVKEDLAPEETPPAIQDSDIADIDTVLASYTTRFAPGARGDNIGLAANHLQGVLVRSQDTFSFNDTVGPRTRALGFKDAGVIINGKHAIDSGGGVCQVSSTLYNAVLLAGLTSIERQSHYFPSTYCPPGRDATVADGLIDFKFKNELQHPVYLQVSNTGRSLTIYVLGTKADLGGNQLRLERSGSSMNPSIYRIWSQNGTVTNREYLHTDHYEA